MLTQEELFTKIDASLAAMVGGQAEAQARIAELSKTNGEVMARIKAADETIKSQQDHLFEIEKKVNTFRFGTGGSGDAFLEAIPADKRHWCERVERESETSPWLRRAKKDPAKTVLMGLHLSALINRAMALTKGNGSAVERHGAEEARLFDVLSPGMTPELKVALQEDTAAEGGNLIPVVTEAEIGVLLKEAAVLRAAGVTILTMTTKTHQLPSLAADFTVTHTSEEGTIADSVPATPFGSGNLTANKHTGLVTVSLELIQDNIVNLMNFVMTHLVQQVGRSEDAQGLEGTGAPFSGLFTVAGVNSVAGGSAALTEVNVRKLIFGGEHWTTTEQGVIWCHPWIIRDAMGLVTSNAIWFPYLMTNSPIGSVPNLWGVRAFPTSTILRNRGAGTNETTAYYGRPSAIVIGDRAGMTFDTDPYGLFASAQVRLRLMRRYGILVWIPGYFTKLTATTVAA